jgi:hypothetical protein
MKASKSKTDFWKLAETLQVSEIPMKLVPDWPPLYQKLVSDGAVILECAPDQLRTSKAGGIEAPPVKCFNNYVRLQHKQPLRTKRISQTKWICYL